MTDWGDGATILNFLERQLGRVENAAILLSGVSLAIIMVVVVIDVAMRYLFNSPLMWAYVLLSKYLIPLSFFLALSQTLRLHEHINVDFFVHALSDRAKVVFISFGLVASFVVFAFVTYISALDAFHTAVRGEKFVGYYVWPAWPAKIVVPMGVALMAMRILLQLLWIWRCGARALPGREA